MSLSTVAYRAVSVHDSDGALSDGDRAASSASPPLPARMSKAVRPRWQQACLACMDCITHAPARWRTLSLARRSAVWGGAVLLALLLLWLYPFQRTFSWTPPEGHVPSHSLTARMPLHAHYCASK